MGLSSNILWHQTEFDKLKNILKSKKIKCSYCIETFMGTTGKIAFPMISLSDIALADFIEYIDQYGGQSLGFSRDWVKNKGFNPVWYCEKNQAIEAHKKTLHDQINKKNDDINIYLLSLYYSAYIKPIEGPLYVKSKRKTYENYRFYNEREYRYVPDFKELMEKNILPFLTEEQYEKYKKTNDATTINYEIPFSLDDIKMIIVRTKNQVDEIKKILNYNDKIHIFSHDEIKQNIIGIGHQIEKK